MHEKGAGKKSKLARRASCQEEQAGIESSLVKLLGCDAGELRVLVRLSLVQQLPMASLAGFAFNEHRTGVCEPSAQPRHSALAAEPCCACAAC